MIEDEDGGKDDLDGSMSRGKNVGDEADGEERRLMMDHPFEVETGFEIGGIQEEINGSGSGMTCEEKDELSAQSGTVRGPDDRLGMDGRGRNQGPKVPHNETNGHANPLASSASSKSFGDQGNEIINLEDEDDAMDIVDEDGHQSNNASGSGTSVPAYIPPTSRSLLTSRTDRNPVLTRSIPSPMPNISLDYPNISLEIIFVACSSTWTAEHARNMCDYVESSVFIHNFGWEYAIHRALNDDEVNFLMTHWYETKKHASDSKFVHDEDGLDWARVMLEEKLKEIRKGARDNQKRAREKAADQSGKSDKGKGKRPRSPSPINSATNKEALGLEHILGITGESPLKRRRAERSPLFASDKTCSSSTQSCLPNQNQTIDLDQEDEASVIADGSDLNVVTPGKTPEAVPHPSQHEGYAKSEVPLDDDEDEVQFIPNTPMDDTSQDMISVRRWKDTEIRFLRKAVMLYGRLHGWAEIKKYMDTHAKEGNKRANWSLKVCKPGGILHC